LKEAAPQTPVPALRRRCLTSEEDAVILDFVPKEAPSRCLQAGEKYNRDLYLRRKTTHDRRIALPGRTFCVFKSSRDASLNVAEEQEGENQRIGSRYEEQLNGLFGIKLDALSFALLQCPFIAFRGDSSLRRRKGRLPLTHAHSSCNLLETGVLLEIRHTF
jgi:hypothetical protein